MKITQRSFVFGLFFAGIISSQSSWAAFSVSSGNVDFYATGKPSMLKIHGEDSDLRGTITPNKTTYDGDFKTTLSNFSSGMKLRDAHTKNKVFEVDKFPEAELTFKGLTFKNDTSVPFTGKLKFHGVEKDVVGEVTATVTDQEIKFKATFKMLLTDFGIAPPEFAGMKIENEVKVETQGSAKKN